MSRSLSCPAAQSNLKNHPAVLLSPTPREADLGLFPKSICSSDSIASILPGSCCHHHLSERLIASQSSPISFQAGRGRGSARVNVSDLPHPAEIFHALHSPSDKVQTSLGVSIGSHPNLIPLYCSSPLPSPNTLLFQLHQNTNPSQHAMCLCPRGLAWTILFAWTTLINLSVHLKCHFLCEAFSHFSHSSKHQSSQIKWET